MLGSLTYYRRILNERVFNPGYTELSRLTTILPSQSPTIPRLPVIGHAIAGVMAGVKLPLGFLY